MCLHCIFEAGCRLDLGLIHIVGFLQDFRECVRSFWTQKAPFLALQHLFYFGILRIWGNHIKIRSKSGPQGSLWQSNSSSLNPGPFGWDHIKRPFPESRAPCLSQAPFCRMLVFQDRSRQSRASNSLLSVSPAPCLFLERAHFCFPSGAMRGPAPSVRQAAAPAGGAYFPHSETWLQLSRENTWGALPVGFRPPFLFLALVVLHVLRPRSS